MSIRLGMAQIGVTDMKKAREFYVQTLGFRPVDNGVEGVITLALDNDPILLLYPVESTVPIDYPDQMGTILVFHVRDIETAVRQWRERGVAFIPISWSDEPSGIADCPFGRFIAVKDPFGNVFELLQPS